MNALPIVDLWLVARLTANCINNKHIVYKYPEKSINVYFVYILIIKAEHRRGPISGLKKEETICGDHVEMIAQHQVYNNKTTTRRC